jgi:hypothetical protein
MEPARRRRGLEYAKALKNYLFADSIAGDDGNPMRIAHLGDGITQQWRCVGLVSERAVVTSDDELVSAPTVDPVTPADRPRRTGIETDMFLLPSTKEVRSEPNAKRLLRRSADRAPFASIVSPMH